MRVLQLNNWFDLHVAGNESREFRRSGGTLTISGALRRKTLERVQPPSPLSFFIDFAAKIHPLHWGSSYVQSVEDAIQEIRHLVSVWKDKITREQILGIQWEIRYFQVEHNLCTPICRPWLQCFNPSVRLYRLYCSKSASLKQIWKVTIYPSTHAMFCSVG